MNPSTLTTPTLLAVTSRPSVMASQCNLENIIVGPIAIGRNSKLTFPDEMKVLFPVAIIHTFSNTVPATNGNPILNFLTVQNKEKSKLKISAHGASGKPAYFNFFQFGRIRENEYEVCYSTSLGEHGKVIIDFNFRRAYHWHMLTGALDHADSVIKEGYHIRNSGLLPDGCYSMSAMYPHITRIEGSTLHFSTGKNPLTINQELWGYILPEVVGSGVLFSMRQPGATFRYQGHDLQHLHVVFTHPKEVGGRTYYGGQCTTFHNNGRKVDASIVDLHQTLLHQILFGCTQKGIVEELMVLRTADVFIGFQDLVISYNEVKKLLGTADNADSQALHINAFNQSADIISYMADKLEDKEETRYLKALCLFGKLQARSLDPSGDAADNDRLLNELLAQTQQMRNESIRNQLYSFFTGEQWQVDRETLFGP